MARRAPLKATGEPRAPTFNTSELLQTGRASPGWAWTRSWRQLTGTFGRLGGKLLSEHIEVESGKNNDLQRLQPCHLARLARNQVRPSASGAVCGSRRERFGGAQTRAGRSFRAITSTAGAGRHRPKASRLPPPPWVLPSPEAIRGHRARRLGSRWPKFSLVVVDPPLPSGPPHRHNCGAPPTDQGTVNARDDRRRHALSWRLPGGATDA